MVNPSFTRGLGIDLGAGCLFKLHQNTANWGSHSEGCSGRGNSFTLGVQGAPISLERCCERDRMTEHMIFPQEGCHWGLGGAHPCPPTSIPAVWTPYPGIKSTKKTRGLP